MATFNRKPKPAGDNPADIKNRLFTAQKTVKGAAVQSFQNLEAHTQEHIEWRSRAVRVSRMITLTKSKEAKEDLQILLTQAESYRQYFRKLRTQEQEFYSSLSSQLGALQDAVQRFETMELRQELKKDLARLAGNAEISSGTSSASIDLSEINRIIHTAVALIELKEQKEVAA